MPMTPRILLVEGNLRARCDLVVEHGSLSAGDRYAKSLRDVCPGVHIDKIYGAEVDSKLPDGAEIASYDGVVIGGSGLHAYHDEIAVTRQIDLVREIFKTGTPVLGSCWGLQIAVIAAGGAVARASNEREVGLARKITLTVEGLGHPLFQGKASVFDSPCIHLDEVTHIPGGAVVLASNNHSRVQALSFAVQGTDFWGVQYHPEFDLFHMARLAVLYSDIMIEGGFYHTIEEGKALAADMETLHADPSRFDLSWKLGVDSDVLDDGIRTLEIRNWIEKKVLPSISRRR